MDVLSVAGRAVRLAAATVLLIACAEAASSPLVPWWLSGGAGLLWVVSLVRPWWALALLVTAAPWGARLADVPVRATEFLCFAAIAGWLLRIDRGVLSRDRDSRGALLPGALYALLAGVSWSRLAGAASTNQGWARTLDATRLIPADYLVVAGRDPHTTAAVQILLGVALTIIVAGLLPDRTTARRTVLVLSAGGLAAALATVVAVPVRYWMTGDWNEIIRYFVATRSRYAFHVQDVNAAGSYFVLAAMPAVAVLASTRHRRVWWAAGIAAVLGALWIGGSRAAMAAGFVMAACLLTGWRLVRWGWVWPRLSPRIVGLGVMVVLVVLVLSPAVVGSGSAMSGSASRSLGVRQEFLTTSSRMLATAPVFGVGVGTYYARSTEFMPPALRALYGRENAHNYFMQTAAELGLMGLLAFIWFLGAALLPLWRRLGTDGRPSLALALLAGCTAFLLTSVTGHPLLVVEVAVPFWVALGVAMSGRLE